MEAKHDISPNMPGLDSDLDLAEMEIASGRFGEARLRFARMTRVQRETPRALLLRARATETPDSRRMLATFVRDAIARFEDPTSRAQLAAALAYCGDRSSAMNTLPSERGLSTSELGVRQEALEAMGSVPDLPETQVHSLTAILARKLTPERRPRT
jgi:hypothetical protein